MQLAVRHTVIVRSSARLSPSPLLPLLCCHFSMHIAHCAHQTNCAVVWSSPARLSCSPFLPLLSLFATLPARTFTKFGSQIVNAKIARPVQINREQSAAMSLSLSKVAWYRKMRYPGLTFKNYLKHCSIEYNSTFGEKCLNGLYQILHSVLK